MDARNACGHDGVGDGSVFSARRTSGEQLGHCSNDALRRGRLPLLDRRCDKNEPHPRVQAHFGSGSLFLVTSANSALTRNDATMLHSAMMT